MCKLCTSPSVFSAPHHISSHLWCILCFGVCVSTYEAYGLGIVHTATRAPGLILRSSGMHWDQLLLHSPTPLLPPHQDRVFHHSSPRRCWPSHSTRQVRWAVMMMMMMISGPMMKKSPWGDSEVPELMTRFDCWEEDSLKKTEKLLHMTSKVATHV